MTGVYDYTVYVQTEYHWPRTLMIGIYDYTVYVQTEYHWPTTLMIGLDVQIGEQRSNISIPGSQIICVNCRSHVSRSDVSFIRMTRATPRHNVCFEKYVRLTVDEYMRCRLFSCRTYLHYYATSVRL